MLSPRWNRQRFTWLRRKTVGSHYVRGVVNADGTITFYANGKAPRLPAGIVERYPSKLRFGGEVR